jgi:hypothetical protein
MYELFDRNPISQSRHKPQNECRRSKEDQPRAESALGSKTEVRRSTG